MHLLILSSLQFIAASKTLYAQSDLLKLGCVLTMHQCNISLNPVFQLRLLSTKHQQEFRNAAEMDWPGVGSFYTVGAGGAGEYAFVKVKNAGHRKLHGFGKNEH